MTSGGHAQLGKWIFDNVCRLHKRLPQHTRGRRCMVFDEAMLLHRGGIDYRTTESMVHQLRILNLGAGVQSTVVYLLYTTGEITPTIDYAIFADTGEEAII